MVATTLWEQVDALPLRERLDLADHIRASVPELPLGILPDTPEELAAALATAHAEAIEHPETLVSGDDLIASAIGAPTCAVSRTSCGSRSRVRRPWFWR